VHSTILEYTHSFLKDSHIKESWDNMADAPQSEDSPTHESATACGAACNADQDCLQWSYFDNTCKFGHFIQMGGPADKAFVSGWDTETMMKLGFKNDTDYSDSCKEAMWMKPDHQ
jgi:hypothetical protein